MLFSLILSSKDTYDSEYTGEAMVDLLSTTFRLPETFDASASPLPPELSARCDLVAKDAYGDSLPHDIINKLNTTGNPFDISPSAIVVWPTSSDTSIFIVNPSSKWENVETSGTSIISGTQVHTTPTQAISSSTRFNIDTLSKVVRY